MPEFSNTRHEILSLDLLSDGQSVQFQFKSMEDAGRQMEKYQHIPHRHNYYSIIWVTDGQGKHIIDFKTYIVKPGAIYFISPEQVHDLQMHGPYQGFVFLFTTDFAEQNGIPVNWLQDSGFFYRCDDTRTFIITEEKDKQKLRRLTDLILEESELTDRYRAEAIGSLLKLFLLECKRIDETVKINSDIKPAARSQLIKQFKDLLDNNFAIWHKVSEYARELHITPNYLNEVLSGETGMSAKDFIINRIMLEAKRFATHSDINAKEIAYKLGFDDPAHFSKLFKQHQKQSFTAFRHALRETKQD